MPNGWNIKARLEDIEGIGEKFAKKLRGAGVRSVHGLLVKGSEPKGRREIARAIGMKEGVVLEWVNRADLFRIKGIGEQYSDLLEKSGVDTVVELAQRSPQNLYETLLQVNSSSKKMLVRRLPTQAQVKDWIKQAKSAKRVVKF